MPTRSKRHYRRTRRAGVHVSTGFRSKSLDAAQAWGLPAAVRDSVLGEHGDQALRERYEPLRPEP